MGDATCGAFPGGESVISRVVRLMHAFDRDVPSRSRTELVRRASLPLTLREIALRVVGAAVAPR